tara:strand:+ start:3073 stop:4281 length:1209 start_codon:yes stop_codon:yes gene_type:complete
LSYIVSSFDQIIGDKWAYNNLFINYSTGLVRRGLLGEIFIIINEISGIEPLKFFTSIFFIAYLLQIYFFYKLLFNYKNFKVFITFFTLSPALMLFYIYDLNVFLSKDIFIVLAILFHALTIHQNRSDEKYYKKFLYFIMIPILILNSANHENQIFFIPFHCLLTLYFFSSKKNIKYDLKFLKPYIILIIPIIILLTSSGSFEKLSILNESISKYDAKIPNQFAGNFNLAIGGFIKWHFFYHGPKDFINLLFCFFLSLFLFYLIFDYMIKNNLLVIHKSLNNFYLIIISPAFLILLIMLDHGRSLHLLTIHLVAFFLTLRLNITKIKKTVLNIKKSFFTIRLLFIFLIFYLFFWYLPQGGGFTGIGNFSSLYKSSLINELLRLFLIIFNYVDAEIINLPRIYI